ncbi:DUF6919 domain-containing protein [Asanoa siamensis]|uniref:DUF6919 domain-containing protein n=1 Tax=Asanoa siamensis TaxID=926357 RepID=A0ABQ4CWH3_9ACTN|nr:hypothetical protein [Asanoa siamensis]GIF75639.1 hypothetical protein Asi02nite_51570 [Asanoa siamensis]
MTAQEPPLTWLTASSMADLGELTARWVIGELEDTPIHGGPPDDETRPLIPLLAAVNRSGFVTDFSQPGNAAWEQRATICGYCDDATCDVLAAAFAPTDVILLHERGDSGIRVPVTLDQGKPFTWVGGAPALDVWVSETTDAAVRALEASWYVTIVDPVWGRDDRLWPLLATALGLASVSGSPGPAIGPTAPAADRRTG